jgi:hypothetical protein
MSRAQRDPALPADTGGWCRACCASSSDDVLLRKGAPTKRIW